MGCGGLPGAAFALLLGACAAPPAPGSPAPRAAVVRPAPLPARAPRYAAATRSPVPVDAEEADELAPLRAACGERDATLDRVAALLVHDADRDPDRVTTLLRENGEPHVRPRVVRAPERAAAAPVLAHLRTPTTRCGLAADGAAGALAVLVEAAADLAPLPTHARTGSWLSFVAPIRVPVTAARLVVLGPRGAPRTVPTALDHGEARARFALEAPGAFTVQLVADRAGGPEPLLEARIFADVADDGPAAAAPGEEAGEDADALARMTAVLRASEALPPLRREAALDGVAESHVARMAAAGRIAHDLGDGDVVARLADAGVTAHVVGENVARARSVALAHRALHASPSHRTNLLDRRFRTVGFATTVATDGTVYVCEVFADR